MTDSFLYVFFKNHTIIELLYKETWKKKGGNVMKYSHGNYMRLVSGKDEVAITGFKEPLEIIVLFPTYLKEEECEFELVEQTIVTAVSDFSERESYKRCENVEQLQDELGEFIENALVKNGFEFSVCIFVGVGTESASWQE